MPSNHLILCHPLLLLTSIFPSISVFSNELVHCIRWPSIGISASTLVLPMNTQDWFPLGLNGWISLQSKGLSRVLSNTTVQILLCSAFIIVQLSHPYMTSGKIIALTRRTFVDKVMSLLFNKRGWDGWMASPTKWTWVWANSRRWWKTGKPGMLQSMGSQGVRCDGVAEQQHTSKKKYF